MKPFLCAAVLCVASAMSSFAGSIVQYSMLSFDQLEGWERDDHEAAMRAFVETCADVKAQEWPSICAVAQSQKPGAARAFFELFFRPILIEDGKDALFTAYFEPELDGSRVRSDRFQYPIYATPPELKRGSRWLSRRELLTSGVMEDRGLEIAWVDDPVELFFLQIQGSGRIRLAEGGMLRVGYGGSNGHPYRSVGTELVRRGVFQPHQVSAQVIQNWVRQNPEPGSELLYHNPSYVFFRKVNRVPAEKGPLGAMNRSVTPLRTVAVDPKYVPLGAPVWVEKDGKNPMRKLMIAQDTGSAIKGAQRADIFFGTGEQAGRKAGRIRDPGRMVVLMPIQEAYALVPDGA